MKAKTVWDPVRQKYAVETNIPKMVGENFSRIVPLMPEGFVEWLGDPPPVSNERSETSVEKKEGETP